ncbi:MAG: hypothetical protein RLZZ157_500 [Pseudomonadota bacterium]|jgi:glycosyltransferase involved in cell wall biosynthesis
MPAQSPATPADGPLDVSVIVPVYHEAEAVEGLVGEIAAALDGWAYEMIFVDDASRDETLARLLALKAQFPALRVLANRKNGGQSRAIINGVLAARAPVIATLDGDGQNDPADLLALLIRLNRAEAPPSLAYVGGRRVKRQDSAAKKQASLWANRVRRALLNDGADDSGCGIRVMKRDVLLRLPYFDHMHRYLPALMLREGAELEFVDVNHRHRLTGASKYTNLGRLWAALSDLFGVMWLRARRRDFGGVDER